VYSRCGRCGVSSDPVLPGVWLKSPPTPPTPPTVMTGPLYECSTPPTARQRNYWWRVLWGVGWAQKVYYDNLGRGQAPSPDPTSDRRHYRYHRPLQAGYYGRWCRWCRWRRWWLQWYRNGNVSVSLMTNAKSSNNDINTAKITKHFEQHRISNSVYKLDGSV